jgi:E3 SUMO-protein ligase NSE2
LKEVRRRDALEDKKSPAEKYGNVSEFLDFKRRVWDVKHANQPAPATWFPTATIGTAMEEDDDLILDQEIQSLKCPITLSLLEKPVRNDNCVHVYSLNAIKELVRQGRGHCKCPVAGCSAEVTMKSVKEDKAMARRVMLEKNRLEERMDEERDEVHEIPDGTSMIIEDLKDE